MSNWKTNSKTSQLIGFLGFIVICVVFAFLFKNENARYYMFIMLAYQLLYTNIAFIVYWFICNVIFDSMVLKYGSYSE